MTFIKTNLTDCSCNSGTAAVDNNISRLTGIWKANAHCIYVFVTPSLKCSHFFQVYQTLGSRAQLMCKDGPLLYTSLLLQAGQETRGGCGALQEGGGA